MKTLMHVDEASDVCEDRSKRCGFVDINWATDSSDDDAAFCYVSNLQASYT